MVMKPWWVMIDTDRKTGVQHFASEGEALACILPYFGPLDEDITSLQMLQDVEDSADDPDVLHPNLYRWEWGCEQPEDVQLWYVIVDNDTLEFKLSRTEADAIAFARDYFLVGEEHHIEHLDELHHEDLYWDSCRIDWGTINLSNLK